MPNGQSQSPGRALANFVGSGGNEASTIAVQSTVVRIGQGSQNEIVLEDDTVSTSHARLEYADGAWRLTDLESKNGTYLEGARLEPGVPTAVPDQAAVAFGAMKLRFEVEAGAEPAEVSSADATAKLRRSEPRRTGFRLPVWLFLVIILILAVIVFLLVTMMGDPTLTDPVPNASPALLPGAAELLMDA
jgi:pSer/pThr/pTyr-binding forkhead associated (FHA) protein